MPVIRGLSAAVWLCSWEEKRWTVVCLAVLTWSSVCTCMWTSVVWLHGFFFISRKSSQNIMLWFCLSFTVSMWVSGALHRLGRHVTRKERSGWGLTRQGGFRTQAVSSRSLLLELPALLPENTTTLTYVSIKDYNMSVNVIYLHFHSIQLCEIATKFISWHLTYRAGLTLQFI